MKTVDQLTEDIFKAIEPPIGNWKRPETEAIAGVLVGAAAALFQYRDLARKHGKESEHSHASTWKIDQAFQQFRRCIEEHGTISWSNGADFGPWARTYFLNRVQHNIAGVLDRCLNAWLALCFKWPVNDPSVDDLWTSIWPGTRLKILSGFLGLSSKLTDSVRMVKDLHKAFTKEMGIEKIGRQEIQKVNVSYTEGAQEWLSFLTHQCGKSLRKPLRNELEIYELLPEEEGAWYVACACARTNAFKHKILTGLERRDLNEFLLEGVVTARALQFMGRFFWKAMVLETQRYSLPEGTEAQ